MRAALLLLALVGAGFWLANRPRRRSYQALVRRAYRRMDVAFGIKAYVLEHRASQRRKWGWLLGRKMTDFLWPTTQFGTVAALPFLARREQYIHLHIRPVPWPRRYFTWHVSGMTGTWTTEVDANAAGFIERAERAFADFLYLKHKPGMFKVADHRDDHPPAGKLTLTRTKPAPIPERVPFEGEVVQ